MKKEYKNFIFLILLGVIFGIISKLGDVIVTGNILTDIISAFGRVSSSFTIWIFMCLLISNKSKNKKYAVINVLIFLIAMLISYYTYSKLIVGYFSFNIAKFWLIMLVPSGVASYLVYDIKNKRIMKFLVAITTIILGLIGIIFIEGIEIYALVIEILLFIMIGVILFKSKP